MAAIERKRFGAVSDSEKSTKLPDEAEVITAEPAFIEKPVKPRKKPDIQKIKPDLSVTQIINTTPSRKNIEPAEVVNAEEMKPVKPVKIQRFKPETGQFDKIPAPVKPAPPSASPAPVTIPVPAVKIENDNPKNNLKDNLSVTKILSDTPAPASKPQKPTYLLPEEKERLQKLKEDELLQKDLALEDPDDLIDGINPYDVKEIETSVIEADIASVKITRDMALDDEDTTDDIYESPPEQTAEKVKEYTPAKSKSTDPKVKRSNSALLESLNDALAKKRESDINARRTLNVDTLSSVGSGGDYRGRTLPAKLNIDYKKQIIEDSSVLPSSDLLFRQVEEQELGKKKKRKIRDFILEDIEDDNYSDDYEDETAEDDSDEYDGYDSSAAIWNDLNESHKGLKWRFVLLFLLTAGLTFFTILHDLGFENRFTQHILQNWFEGMPGSYASALVYTNLIVGVIGMSICSGVILRGLQNLFTGKADCDSACAVPCVMTVAAAAVQLNETNLLQQGWAHIYVSVAMFSLMFNTLGKILMISRAKKNFSFISGDSVKYFADMPDDDDAAIFTKGIPFQEIPLPVFLRKTEFLTNYLKNSYCTDLADIICRKLIPFIAILSAVIGIAAYLLPLGSEEMQVHSLYWAVTAGSAFIVILSPFSIMFLVNNPLLRAVKSLSKSDSVVMGYKAAEKFARTNAVVIEAGMLFPAGSVKFLNVKRCQKPNAINTVSIDESIVIAASLAIKADSIMSNMFYDMISGDSELLYKIENCIYEVNMGITGWMGTKRVMLGNREQMKHHGVDVPAVNKERKHCPENGEVVYLAVGGETVAMFFIEVVPNPAVKACLQELEINGIALAVKTKDSLVTVAKLSDIFDLNPERIRILPFDLHSRFNDYSKYTSRGNSEIACNGTLTSFTRALICAKTMIRDMTVTSASMFIGLFLAGVLGLLFTLFVIPGMMTASGIIAYNMTWLVIMLILQGLRRY